MLGELVVIFVDNIAPILIIAGLGLVVARRFEVPPRPVGTLIFNIFSPALIFSSLFHSHINGTEFILLLGATISFQMGMAGLAYWLARRDDPVTRANMMIAAFCSNTGNYGLPLVSWAFGPDIFSRAVIVMVVNTITNYTLGVYVASNGRASPAQAFLNVLRTPAVYALALALLLRGLNISLPITLDRTVSLLADASIPLMIILLGLQLGQKAQWVGLQRLGRGVALKLIVAPALAYGIALFLQLPVPALTALVIQSSMPTAVVTIILASEFDLDRNLAVNLILATTLLSPLTLAPLILWLR